MFYNIFQYLVPFWSYSGLRNAEKVLCHLTEQIFTFTCKISALYNTFERNNFILDHLSRGMSLTTGYRHRLVKLAIC